jgi:hypothetical protein
MLPREFCREFDLIWARKTGFVAVVPNALG